MGLTDDWRHVMLAMRFELDVAKYNHLVIAFDFLKRPSQVAYRVVFVATEPVLVGGRYPLGRIEQPFTARIFASP